jgi:phosphatidylinositol alpha-1,6-mannosyltransferase
MDGAAAKLLGETRKRYGLEGAFVLLTIARLVPRKGHLTVLHALAGLRGRIPELRYVVVGTGPMRDELEETVKELSLDEMVTFAGGVSDQIRTSLLQACDVFVMPNRDIKGPQGVLATEGFGIVFLEASACAKPVIGGRAGGAPEVILDGRTGFLIDPEDPKELEQAILRLWSDRDLAVRFGLAGRERVEREFSWKGLSAKYVTEMNAVLPAPGSESGGPKK